MAIAGQSSCKCILPVGTSSRNLVVCIDGTCNRPGTKNTNILELCSQLVKSDDQLVFYNTGLGVSPDIPGYNGISHQLSDGIDILFGWHLEKGIMLAYRWLSNMYKDGDKIFLFGFSRGAYQVRALAGMVEIIGLLSPNNEHLIPFAFEAYTKFDEAQIKQFQATEAFKNAFLRAARVHFVGVWETVSSVGVLRGKTLPLTTSCDHICYFRHALALDERRVKFLPEYVYGGRTDTAYNDHIKEVWFPGSHSDVGGGNRLNPQLQSGEIPLLWMRGEASLAGLQLKPSVVMWKIDDLDQRITHPLNPGWWILEALPLQHLCYNNTNRTTSWPHMGGSRQILQGQKVHVSALFKNNYRPRATFHRGFETWPAAMFWNDPRNHDRLQELSSTWEMDIFDSRSVQSLLDVLQQRRTNLDALERLAFMASFDNGRNITAGTANARQTLTSLLEDGNHYVRINAAVTCCEVGWELPLQPEHDGEPRVLERIVLDICSLLESNDPRRACMSLPSLCKNNYFKGRLLSESNVRRLLRLIVASQTDTSRHKHENEGVSPSSIAFHSAQALASLLELNESLCLRVTQMGGLSDLIPTLYNDHDTVLVAVMRTLTSLARHGDARKIMCAAAIVPTLLNLAKRCDDFVAPVAIDLLCLLLDEAPMQTFSMNGALPLFVEMSGKRSNVVKQAGAKALAEFAKHDEQGLVKGGCVEKLAKQAHNCYPDLQDGAIMSLVKLNAQVPIIVRDVLAEAKTVETLVSRLRHKSRCLTAISALVRLVAIDYVADAVIKSEAPLYIRKMLKHRWFDGNDGEDGVGALQSLLSVDALRARLLEVGIVDSLLAMLQEGDSDIVYAGLQYLREVIRYDDGKHAACVKEMIVPALLNALGYPRAPLQRSAVTVLNVLFDQEDLRPVILEKLLLMLKSRKAGPLYGATTALRVLCFSGARPQCPTVTDKVVEELRCEVLANSNFWSLSHDYYNALDVQFDKKSPTFREVYQSVGLLITSAQEGITNNTNDSQWLELAPYELEKGWNPVLKCAEAFGTLLHPPLSLFKSLRLHATNRWK